MTALALGAFGCSPALVVGVSQDGADAGAASDSGAAPMLVPCPAGSSRETIADIDAAFGSVRAVVADGSHVYVATAAADGTGSLLRVASAPRATVESFASLTSAPRHAAIDATAVYVTAADGSVARVPKDGSAVAAVPGQAGASAIVADGIGGAYWTVAAPPASIAYSTFSPAQAIALDAGVTAPAALAFDGSHLVVAGYRSMALLVPLMGAAPMPLANRCDGTALALGIGAALCSEADTVVRVPLDGSASATVGAFAGTVTELVTGGGRAFVGIVPRPGGSGPVPTVMSLSLDDLSAATIADVPAGAASLAIDRCFLYYLSGRTLERNPL
jgi:hypothetical protein